MGKHFIDREYIENLLGEAKRTGDGEISRILDKAERFEGLKHREIAALLATENPDHVKRIFSIAGEIKR
ncbi:MAG: [FeFe] hydrogenase H-cluster radical SAM maturase HydG, partial [Treponema sp.]|nr:[FeFe] hydrogenase H-cluster radical SAM maturase HydG [Treponema sp.]